MCKAPVLRLRRSGRFRNPATDVPPAGQDGAQPAADTFAFRAPGQPERSPESAARVTRCSPAAGGLRDRSVCRYGADKIHSIWDLAGQLPAPSFQPRRAPSPHVRLDCGFCSGKRTYTLLAATCMEGSFAARNIASHRSWRWDSLAAADLCAVWGGARHVTGRCKHILDTHSRIE